MTSGDRPMPVSRTAKVSSTRSAESGLRTHRQHDLASLRELNCVAEQIEHDLPQARHVADDSRRNVAFEHVGRVQVLFDRARRDQVQCRFDALAQVEGLRLDVHAAGLDLREIEDVVDDGQ